MVNITYIELYEYYIKRQMFCKDIALLYNTTRKTIENKIKILNIKKFKKYPNRYIIKYSQKIKNRQKDRRLKTHKKTQDIAKHKRTETNQEKFGVDFFTQHKDLIKKNQERRYFELSPNIRNIIENKESFINVFENGKKTRYDVSVELGVSISLINKTLQKYGYSDYFINYNGVSSNEKKLRKLLKENLNENLIFNSRNIIYPKEIDILIPKYKLAIEYNGSFWHTENNDKDKYYHLNKQNLAKQKGYDLIHIYEYEYHPIKILNLIKNRIGLCEKIYARKTKIGIVDIKTAKDFFNKYHIQNTSSYLGKCFGLFYDDVLVMCICIGKSRFKKNEMELIRVATKSNIVVVGGLSKLLKYSQNFLNFNSIYTYTHKHLFTGRGYEAVGFKKIQNIEPSYVWFKNGNVLTRYQTQKHKLKNLFPDIYNIKLTEREIMELAGYSRIFNCGTIKWKLNYKKD